MSTLASLRQKLKKKAKLVVSTSRNTLRTRKDENSFDKDGIFYKENDGSKGKLKKRMKFKGIESGENGSGREFGEKRGKLRTLDSYGRKKRIYAKEGMVENGKLLNGVGASKKKTLFKKREMQVKDELVEGKTNHRTMWVPGKSGNAGSKAKHSTHKMNYKKENVVLATAKQKTKAKEVGRMEFARADDNGSGLVKKNREQKSELSKGKSKKVVSPLSSAKKKGRDKAGLDDDTEILDDQPKKKKRVIRIDPHDISNKRLGDGIGINGSKEEKKKESEKEPEMSKNAQFRAIQPSPSILSFVEKNLLGRRRMIDLRRAGYNIDLSAPLDNIPFSNSSERERIEENVFRNKLEFFAAAKVLSSFPPPNLPEIAFAGRSNVGKSSLLNALTRQWGVVRTSDKPGLTQSINFFKLGTKLGLVDLPGYGFAYAKEEVKEAWEELVKEYVSTRVGLKRVCLLIDTKWGMKPRDHELIELMERSKTKYQIVLTKTDVVFPIDVARRAMQIEESLLGNKAIVQPMMMVSSKSGAGIRSLRTVLANVARFVKI